jgi:very-short-patch-repair endonuclease
VTAPHDSQPVTAPHENGSEAAPHENGSDAAPRENGSESAPHENGSEAAPRENGSESAPGNGCTDATATRRTALIEAAQAQWVTALTDLGGRNTLLYFKDRRSGTLDLASADPDAVESFRRSGSIRLTRLFRDVDARADAIRRVQVIYRKARELVEERGIRAGYLATGMARWDELFLEPAAPVVLQGLTIIPTRARHDDFELVLDDETEVNPVLLHKLAGVYGVATGKLADERGERLYRLLTGVANAAEVPGFRIERRQVIGTFTYAKLPMVRDLETAADLLADSDVVAAIAGDPEAQELLSADDAAEPVLDSPVDDYSVLDADSSQRSAISTVLAGRSLVIHGPPGTGKSQTIANLIAALVARGRKVLFVAEKRAAIDAVLSRLKGVDLGDMVLDIHDGTRDRLRIARGLGTALDLALQQETTADVGLLRRLSDRQRRLSEHVSALHEVHPPWRLTAFGVQSALLGLPVQAQTSARLPAVERISGAVADQLRDSMREFAYLGGFGLRPGSSPWFGATLPSAEDARHASDLAARLSAHSLPMLVDRVRRACEGTGLTAPHGYRAAAARVRLYEQIGKTTQVLDPTVYAHNPRALAAAMRGRKDSGLGFGERRRLSGQARALYRGPGKPAAEELAGLLAAAADQLAQWRRLLRQPAAGLEDDGSESSLPHQPSGFAELADLNDECARQLAALGAYVRLPEDDLEATLAALVADRDTAWRLPRLYELAGQFDAAGLGPLLDELSRREVTADLAAAAFDHAWYSSILDQIRVRDPRYASARGAELDDIATDFRARDVQYLAANRSRVRRAWAERLREAQDQHPLQARIIRKQAALRRGHMPLRRLLDQTSDVLFALQPCWAMSPLMVSQVLPATRLFDVVIFDEASQIVPADAIPSIMRGHQIVVAGDDRQLPPTSFFRQAGETDDDAEDDEDSLAGLVSFGAGFESILDALRPLLPTRPLTWHYRSRDERLVAFSNSRIYGGALTTFPGVARDDCLRHVVVTQSPEAGQEVSVTAEVDQVVELVLEHARDRPKESLGVIALGIRHAERIDAALRAALADHPDLEGFFADDSPEPFFVKNLERVQGDERDAIILSIGYGKHPDGRMRYQWGPLLRDGGERRLNVAATRAKHRLTLVSSFSSHDVDPDRVTKAGARLLAEYLEYAGSGGTAAATAGSGDLSAFEQDVRDRLAGYGITVVPQYGVGGYRIDFAATHPDDDDRMVLAIEADGASYWEAGSVRDRDRLRGEHLQRLGWNFQRLWSTNWFHDPQGEVRKLAEAYQRALEASDDAADEPADKRAGDPAADEPAPHGGPPSAGATGGAELERVAQPSVPATRGATGSADNPRTPRRVTGSELVADTTPAD